MQDKLRAWWGTWRLLPLALMLGCALGDPTEPEAASGRAAEVTPAQDPEVDFGELPRLFAAPGSAAELRLFLPQPGARGLVLRSVTCGSDQLKALFGIDRVELIELLSSDEARELERLTSRAWALPCPAGKPLRVAYAEPSTWHVQLASRDAAAAAPAADASTPAELVLAIPQTCGALIAHFQVIARAREQRGEEPGTRLVPEIFLPCAKAAAAQAAGSWSADIVIARGRALVRLSQGTSEIYVHRVDGLAPDPSNRAQLNDVLERANERFRLGERRSVSLGRPAQMPQVALDVCTRACAAFVPSHLILHADRLVCADQSPPDVKGECPAGAPALHLEERLAADGATVQHLRRSDDPAWHGGTFAACAGEGSWARALGARVHRDARDLIDEARLRYLDPGTPLVTPCVQEAGCTVEIPPGTDIAATAQTLLGTIHDRCWNGEEVVTLRLGGDVTASGNLTLAAPADARTPACRPTRSALPCGLGSVRIVGARAGVQVRVPSRQCGTAPCRSETPALSVRGPITLEVEDLAWRAAPGPSLPEDLRAASGLPKPHPALPGNRVAIEASQGATLLLRRSSLGATVPADTPMPLQFFAGVRLTDATLFAWQSDVRAYAVAVSANRSRVVVVGSQADAPPELRVLAGARSYPDLIDLAERPTAQPTYFTALRLEGAQTRAFVGGVRLLAPVGIAYLGPGTGQPDLTVVDALIGWNVGCAARTFVRESRALLVSGSGELKLSAVDVQEMGRLLDCVEPARASLVFEQASSFALVEPRIDAGRCQVRRQFEPTRAKCPP